MPNASHGKHKTKKRFLYKEIFSILFCFVFYCGISCCVFLFMCKSSFGLSACKPPADSAPSSPASAVFSRSPDSISKAVVDKETPSRDRSGNSSGGGNGPSNGTLAPSGYAWVPTKGGTKYHSLDTCSAMENPLYVTLDDAIAYGYGPCGKCW